MRRSVETRSSRLRRGSILLPGLLAVVTAPGCAASTTRPPHIVILLADDLGWKDVGYHGSEIPTPHIDRLAAEGVRLEQFYVHPLCTPTRAALMTGRYPFRFGLQVAMIKPWDDAGLPAEERTLAQALHEAGYRTAIVGKWHLGFRRRAYLPTRRGFDHQYGSYGSRIDYLSHDLRGALDWHRDDRPLREEGYATELVAREAERLVLEHDVSQPLFLYVPFQAVHRPHQAPERYAQRVGSIADPRRRKLAAAVIALDDAIARIRAALERQQMLDDTLLVFASDNGGNPDAGSNNTPLRGEKGSIYEGGVRVPAVMLWRARLAGGRVVDAPLHITDLYPTLLARAGASLEQPLPVDGRDAWPEIEGIASRPAEIVLQLNPTRAAIRRGDWKLVAHGRGAAQGEEAYERVELFDLAADPYETSDLAERQSPRVREFLLRLADLAKQAEPPQNTFGAKPPPGFAIPPAWGPVD